MTPQIGLYNSLATQLLGNISIELAELGRLGHEALRGRPQVFALDLERLSGDLMVLGAVGR